jgi:type II restriction enzyme
MSVENFLIIPKQFFTTEIIIKRKPLSETARRAGWVGCNIDISNVSEAGKVFLIKDTKLIDKSIVENSFRKTLFLRDKTLDSKGWIIDLMTCIDLIKKESFTLEDVYKFENKLKIKYPSNNFIKDKIRQQLQVLRDKGIIEFISRGNYKKINYGNL